MLQTSNTAMCIMSVITLIIGTRLCAVPYGRYRFHHVYFSHTINARLAWLLFESPNLFVPSFVLIFNRRIIQSSCNTILLFFFLLHYVHRCIIYPVFRMSEQSANVPVIIVFVAFLFCTWNAWQQAIALLLVHQYSDEWIWDIRFMCGIFIAILGMVVNVDSDARLSRLKGTRRNDFNVTSKYVMPQGGVFEYVSCANYFGEIVEWFGWTLACWSFSSLAFFVHTVCMLGPRAWHHHQFYLRRFPRYPKHRRALIPFLF